MNSIPQIPSRLAAAGAAVASAALGVAGVIQLTDSQSSESTVVGIEHVTLGALTVFLLALAPVILHLGRIAGARRAATVAAAGQVLLGSLTVVSNVRGSDPSFFAAVAIPSNLLWLAGWIGVAVALHRGRRVPAAIAIALPLTWALALPLSMVGGSLLAGAYWLVVAWMLRTGELPRPAVARVGTARS